MKHEHIHAAEEHPHNHLFQFLGGLAFIAIWVSDSFFVRFSTFLSDLVPLGIHLGAAALFMVAGVVFIYKAHQAVFHLHENGLVTAGLFSRLRHPMYFGGLLCYVALVVSTLSLFSLLPVVFNIVIYDRMAAYEENRLQDKFGRAYLDYVKRVRKWFPLRKPASAD